jgi:hypothetical protein
VCRPCTERSLTGQGPRGFEPAALNRRRAGHGGISRRKEDQEEEKFGRFRERYGFLFSDFQPAGAAASRSDSPRSLKRCLVRPAFRFAEGDATREIETPLAESSRCSDWIWSCQRNHWDRE